MIDCCESYKGYEEMSDVSSIAEACRTMVGDKVMERRRAVEQLHNLLRNSSYVSRLDQNTDVGSGFTWNDVFAAAWGYLEKVSFRCFFFLY